MRKLVFLLILCLPALLIAWPHPGELAPDFSLPDTAGVIHHLSDYRGKAVQLLFWTSGSNECVAELPRVQSMYVDYTSRYYMPLAINVQESESIVGNFARLYRYPFLLDSGLVWNEYLITGAMPLNYVIDTAGRVIYAAEGFDEAIIRAYIESTLPPTGYAARPAVTGPVFAVTATPNPAKSAVRFAWHTAQPCRLDIFDITGKSVRTNLSLNAAGSAIWDLRDQRGDPVRNGAYFATVTARQQRQTIRTDIVR